MYFSGTSESQEKVKVAFLRCYKSGPGGSLISVKNASTVLRPKAVILYLLVHVVVFILRKFRLKWCNSHE